jgi:hypothetical protein
MSQIGYGSIVELSVNGGGFVAVDELTELTPPAPTKSNARADYSNMPNDAAIRIDGKIIDYGQTSFTINWTPGDATDTLIQSLVTASTVTVRETFPNGAYWQISGLFASMTPAVPLDGESMTASITLDTTGALATAAAAAPTNTTPPAISGTDLEEGDVLTVWPGAWTGGPTFTFQWKNGGVNINGATGPTYTLVAADAGDDITVTVTGTNSEGSASATSAPVVGASGA